MDLEDLVEQFSDTSENQKKAVFSTLFIASNKLQTLFDNCIPEVSLKQFMLLSIVRQGDEPLTFTQLGSLLGCSRQNIKKLADVLAKKGFVTIGPSPYDTRAMCICPTGKADAYFQNDFSRYQEDLQYLFAVYTEEEVEMLFHLLSKLYIGIENLERQVCPKSEEADSPDGKRVPGEKRPERKEGMKEHMKSTIVLYKSKYGYTKMYAGMIADTLHCGVKEVSEASVDLLLPYDTIIYGGGLYASEINGIGFIRRHFDRLCGKNIVVWATGINSGSDEEAMREVWKHNFPGDMLKNIHTFYLRGGFDYQKLSVVHKIMMNALKWKIKTAKTRSEEEEGLLKIYDTPQCYCDAGNISALVACVRGL